MSPDVDSILLQDEAADAITNFTFSEPSFSEIESGKKASYMFYLGTNVRDAKELKDLDVRIYSGSVYQYLDQEVMKKRFRYSDFSGTTRFVEPEEGESYLSFPIERITGTNNEIMFFDVQFKNGAISSDLPIKMTGELW